MPKGQQKKVSGAICNVPVNCDQTCNVLPRPPERSCIILFKLKCKLDFRGYVHFQAVHPQLIENALNWLDYNNPLYHNVTTDMNNISLDLKELGQLIQIRQLKHVVVNCQQMKLIICKKKMIH